MSKLINTEEVEIDGVVYIVESYDSGAVVKYPKASAEPIEPVEPEPTQLDRIEANTTALLGNESALDVLLGVE